jgi:hypothetical protein
MKLTLLAAFALVAALTSEATLAQGVVVEIGPEQRTRIREYVVERRVRPVIVEGRFAVGATLPAAVETYEVPEAWGPAVRRYRYVYSGDNVILVEPGSRRIVEIID